MQKREDVRSRATTIKKPLHETIHCFRSAGGFIKNERPTSGSAGGFAQNDGPKSRSAQGFIKNEGPESPRNIRIALCLCWLSKAIHGGRA